MALIAEHYMPEPAKAKATGPLGGNSIDSVANWAEPPQAAAFFNPGVGKLGNA